MASEEKLVQVAMEKSVATHPSAVAHGRVAATAMTTQGGQDLTTCRAIPMATGTAREVGREATVPSGVLLLAHSSSSLLPLRIQILQGTLVGACSKGHLPTVAARGPSVVATSLARVGRGGPVPAIRAGPTASRQDSDESQSGEGQRITVDAPQHYKIREKSVATTRYFSRTVGPTHRPPHSSHASLSRTRIQLPNTKFAPERKKPLRVKKE